MSSSLMVIDGLLHEFYQPNTSNGRKREIETELLAFKHSPEAWHMCLRVAAFDYSNASQFLWFFASSTLEYAITRRWNQLSAGDRTLMRETLWNAYVNLSLSEGGVQRQRNFFAQLIALMGKREFPDEHPNYMAHCIALMKSTKLPLGINLLRVTSEEVVSNRDDVTSERKHYFHSCVSMCIPEVMDLITKYLLIAVCYVNDKDIHSLSNTNLMDYSLLTSLPNDNQMRSSLLELLNCAQHIVSWIRTELISEYFLMSILDLSQWRANQPEVSLAALSVLNELLYLQKALPGDNTLVAGVCSLLEQHNASKGQSEMYVDKLRELLRLCSAKYWHKMLNENELLERFLKSLHCFTILKNGALDFTEKLEIWTPIIKGLSMHAKTNRYDDILHQLVAEIMRRTQFLCNKSELELLDNEILEDNTQTEWQQFLTQCIECIALVAETRPNSVFEQVFAHWSRPHVYLMCIEHDIDNGRTAELAHKFKGQTFAEYLRDCSTICQAVVRIAPMLDANDMSPALDGSNIEVKVYLQMLTNTLLTILSFFASNKLNTLNDLELCTFQSDLDYLYAQVLMALRSVLSIKSAPLKSDETLYQLFEALGGIFQSTTATLAPLIYMAASELLLCIATVIRPKCLLDIPAIQSLMQAGPRLCHLPRQVIANVYISLISYFVLPWKNVTDGQQDFPRRCAMLREYVNCLAQNFLELDTIAESKVLGVTVNFLGTCSLVIEFFRDCNNASKEMLVNAFKPVITKAMVIYNTFGGCANGSGSTNSSAISVAVAEFSLSVLRTLPTQLGSQFIREIITLFINVSSREPLTLNRFAVMERILHMFRLIVQQPGNASLSMLPAILDFTIEQILPLLQQSHENNLADNSDISFIVYSLFDDILNHKWQYFYKSHLQQQQQSQQNGLGAPNIDNLHPQHFLAILSAYGQVLISNGNDPSNVRTVLTSMQNVNERWRLYQRPLFRDNLLSHFQSALIQALLNGDGGALHRELLTNALFAMGQVDTLKLRERFATAGFAGNLKIIDDICLATDIPTFSQKLEQLLQDAHCLQQMTQT